MRDGGSVKVGASGDARAIHASYSNIALNDMGQSSEKVKMELA